MSNNILEEINAFTNTRGNDTVRIFYCNYCGEPLQDNGEMFTDILGYTFCNRDCFEKAKKTRRPELSSLQKDFDIHSPRIQIYDDSKRYWHLR